ncbi:MULTISPECIES: zinc ribbon domain-containing protein [unclassified Microcoleus]|uniref:zinc ribbon domain-containing protein n=1 Tax=unclassified Microcoleus TaxID=2642155 RepID=UPI002FD4E733
MKDAFTRCSKTSSNCGNKKDMPLGVRTYYCPGCGRYIDRNCWNASVNILNS